MDLSDDTIPSSAARRLAGGDTDELIREEPLVLEIDGTTLLTMRSPGQDLDFAVGFLHSEGIVARAGDIIDLEYRKGIPLDEPGPGPRGEGVLADRIQIRLRSAASAAGRLALRRTHEIRPSCGVCGVEDLAELMPDIELTSGEPRLTARALASTLQAFEAEQRVFRATGGCHGAAIAHTDGHILGFGEDVGRHNALDKAIGSALRAGYTLDGAVCLLSGRAGYELVAKCLRLALPIVVSLSAASALAFDLCREAGATLIGFARGGTFKIYWDEGRIVT